LPLARPGRCGCPDSARACASRQSGSLSALCCGVTEPKRPLGCTHIVRTAPRCMRARGGRRRACARSRRPLRNARSVNSPARARRAPAARQAAIARAAHTAPPCVCTSTTSSRVYERGASIASSRTCRMKQGLAGSAAQSRGRAELFNHMPYSRAAPLACGH